MTARQLRSRRLISDTLFVLWGGGAALLCYSLVYALRKPYTAAGFDGMEIFGVDYKVAITVTQIVGYLIAKFAGIKIISELKRPRRLAFIASMGLVAELALVAFGLLPQPWNMFAMFFNGLALGCMWGVIFSFIEGRRLTDLLASLLGISIVVSSGMAKSLGLFAMNNLGISEFWMPAVIGGIAFPLLCLLAWTLSRLPQPSKKDIKQKSERLTMNGVGRRNVMRRFMPILVLLFVGNLLLVMLRDVKEDFLVNIFDTTGYSSWFFAQLDSIVTGIILVLFALMTFVKKNIRALTILLVLVIAGAAVMSVISFGYDVVKLSPVNWLFVQSLCLYIGYLAFQTLFFDRFIACFKVKGNVGFFIATIDAIGYTGTVVVLMIKEFGTPDLDWLAFYNLLAGCVGVFCGAAFLATLVLILRRYRKEQTALHESQRGVILIPAWQRRAVGPQPSPAEGQSRYAPDPPLAASYKTAFDRVTTSF